MFATSVLMSVGVAVVSAATADVSRPVDVDCGRQLFVNAESRYGSVRAEILGSDGQPLPGFTADDCTPIALRDTTKAELVFRGGSLASLGRKGVRIRFTLHCATLYSFWLSPTARGESRGYVAAGGPDYPGLRDMPPPAMAVVIPKLE